MLNLRITDADFYKNSQAEYLSNAGRYGARGVVQNEEGQVILMYMASKNRYKLPGGGIEPEETR
ncbi:MAG: NUDIX hydrolase, partial [Clostridia bacterium]